VGHAGVRPGVDLAPSFARGSGRPSLRRGDRDWYLMLQSLMAVWAAGATFFLLLVVAGDPRPSVAYALVRIDVLSFTVLAILIVGRERLPSWTPDVCAYLLATIVGLVILVYGDPESPYAFFYLWLSVHSFFFLPWRRAAPQVAYIGVSYALILLAVPGGFPTLRWVVTMTTTVVVCGMVARLRSGLDDLVHRLEGLATTDFLTGLRNRRAYEELIEVEVARAERTGLPLALVLGDLDHFKQVNDRLGHAQGDLVLQRVARRMLRNQRRIDTAVRLGGEEFALVLPNTDTHGAWVVAERLRQALRAEFESDPVRLTMSFGVACYPHDAADATGLFAAADRALLEAKRTGRDRVVRYSRGGASPK
jgi:diguanylate cyclase (GGDEF)-like protein